MDTLLRRRSMMVGGGSPLPYTPVEYIQTDGNAYINTGIYGNDGRSVELKFLPTQATYHVVIGAGNSEGSGMFIMLFISGSGLAGFAHYYGYTTGAPSVVNSITNETPFVAKSAMKKGSQSISVKQDGESSFTTLSKTQNTGISTNKQMYLFATNVNDTAQAKCLNGERIYYCKIYSDSNYTNLAFDGIPCVYNGEYGLWDNVSDSFFGNAAASGAFSGPSNS